MFRIKEIRTANGLLQYRTENLTGLACRISPGRKDRHIDQDMFIPVSSDPCPFCPENVFTLTPAFPDGNRPVRGESVTFPNLFPFGECHIVTAVTRSHFVRKFTHRQIADAILSQIDVLRRCDGYPSINWNFLPSAGASLIHPHMQGLSDPRPSRIVFLYLQASRNYRRRYFRNYWDVVKEEERLSERFLFEDEIFWTAHSVPLGEREVRGILPISYLHQLTDYVDVLARGILEILSLYRDLHTSAFNISIFFDRNGKDHGFSAFCSIISRINPNTSSRGDSAFMERLHLEPVILTLPEDLGMYYKSMKTRKKERI